jgi:16S rRNA G966 N2-methylase RsmD
LDSKLRGKDITALEKKIKDIIHDLSTGPIQRYIREHENSNVRDLVLRHKAVLGISSVQIFEQIASRKKAKEKLPLFYRTDGIIFPPVANFEQSSSEATARYKADIVARLANSSVADLTGGFGIDTFFISQRIHTAQYVEPEEFLLEIARHNHKLLGAFNIRYHATTAAEFLAETTETFDLVYVDPSRRTAERKKIIGFDDSRPNVVELKNVILQKTGLILIKASPLLDIQAGISQLGNVIKVFVIAVDNECKELLFLCGRNFLEVQSIEAVNLGDPIERFEFFAHEERDQSVTFSDPLRYLYEPNASILKAGAFKSIASRFGLKKIAANTHLYTSDTYDPAFPGRKFKIDAMIKSDPSETKRHFPDRKANVTTRNYPLTVNELRKKMGLKDGGEKFLIGFSGLSKKFLAVGTRV